MDQSSRTAALDSFRRGEVKLLVASDVAARGLDIPAVSHIFNFDVPYHADDYVHRIGRTGRAGRSGTAISVVAPSDQKNVAAIVKLIGQTIPWMDGPPRVAGEELVAAEAPHINAERPRRRGRSSRKAPRSDAAPVTRLDEARARRTKHTGEASGPQHKPAHKVVARSGARAEGGHLPAFLLRPVRMKPTI